MNKQDKELIINLVEDISHVKLDSMEWISVDERLPDYDLCGSEFLCIVKVETSFQDYEIAEWFNPMVDTTEEESKTFEKHEQPHFNIKSSYCGQQSLDRDVTHWMLLPELPRL